MTGLQVATPRVESTPLVHKLRDYLVLAKPRVVVMVMAVTAVGYYLGLLGAPDWLRLLHLMFGTALAAGGTLALNAYVERTEDALMSRTELRPLPDGRLEPTAALRFGLAAALIGCAYLLIMVHPLCAALIALTTLIYLFGYTPLKRKTSLCTLVGAIPGALPPVVGWAAARGTLMGEVWILFAILFLWQLPHSLAIAWLYREDYTRAGFRLLPVIHPDGGSTGRHIVINNLALLAVGLLPTLVGLAGTLYFVAALGLGLMFLGFGVELAFVRTTAAARRLLLASLLYLPVIFMFMALDKVPQL